MRNHVSELNTFFPLLAIYQASNTLRQIVLTIRPTREQSRSPNQVQDYCTKLLQRYSPMHAYSLVDPGLAIQGGKVVRKACFSPTSLELAPQPSICHRFILGIIQHIKRVWQPQNTLMDQIPQRREPAEISSEATKPVHHLCLLQMIGSAHIHAHSNKS